MCRLLAVVSDAPSNFRFTLRDAPRSLAVLSREHPDGWGLAVHRQGAGLAIHKQPACAGDDESFGHVAASAAGEVLVAHVRKQTVGSIAPQNTHPFRRGPWSFAHNGTIKDVDFLDGRTSEARRAEVTGETDSERLLAYLMTSIDEAGATAGASGAASGAVDRALFAAVGRCLERGSFGSASFLLSDGDVLFAHRNGRGLFLLERGDEPQTAAPVPGGASPGRRRAVLVASEAITSEPWQEVQEGTLLRVDRGPRPSCSVVPASGAVNADGRRWGAAGGLRRAPQALPHVVVAS